MTQETVEEIFNAVAEAAPVISSGLKHRREYLEGENPSGEAQLEADIWADEILKDKISSIDGVCEYASEEAEDVHYCGEGLSVTVDPLDGSSNIPANNIVGTIVGVYDGELPCSGEKMVAAMYVVYGPLTTIVKAFDGSVDEYVVDKPEKEIEIHKVSEDIELPEPKIYGFGGRRPKWTSDFKEVAERIEQELKLRYGGSLVGDFNQVLHKGGIFAYPALKDRPDGKLRLLFEGNPMAFIVETAGGASSNGEKSILEVEASDLHQRTPLYLGNRGLVQRFQDEE